MEVNLDGYNSPFLKRILSLESLSHLFNLFSITSLSYAPYLIIIRTSYVSFVYLLDHLIHNFNRV